VGPEPRHLSVADVVAMHALITERMGAPSSRLRDEGRLEAAVMRPRMAAHYAQADLVRQATWLAVGITQAQAYVDGNKRAAFAAADVFLRINGLEYQGPPLDLARQLIALATRDDSLEAAANRLERWLRRHVQPVAR